MDKVAKGPDYNKHTHTHKQINKQKITRYVRAELPAKRQITTTSNLQRKKNWNRNLKPKNEMAIIYYTCNNEW